MAVGARFRKPASAGGSVSLLDASGPSSVPGELAASRGLRVRPQRPMRALVGVLVVLAGVVAALAVYTRVGDRSEVLMLSRTVLAGEELSAGDLRVVSIASDEEFAAVPAAQLNELVGRYAKYRLPVGSLLVADSVQSTRLVDPERVLGSVTVPIGRVPVGLREQSRVWLVVPLGQDPSGRDRVPLLVEATVIDVPSDLAELIGGDESGRGVVAISVEIDPRYGGIVGLAQSVGVLLIDPNSPLVLPSAEELIALVDDEQPVSSTPGAGSPAAQPSVAPSTTVAGG
jgi:hypothetical protein